MTISKRFFIVDFLRAFSALIVLNSHISGAFRSDAGRGVSNAITNLFIQPIWNLTGAHPGVIIFIVLSGFLIHNTNKHRHSSYFTQMYWVAYLKKRSLRIFPVLLFAILLGMLAVYLQENQLPGIHNILAGFVESFYWNAASLPGNDILNTVITEYWIYILVYPLFVLGGKGKWILLVSGLLYSANFVHGYFMPVSYLYNAWLGRNFWTFQFLWLIGAWFSENEHKIKLLFSNKRFSRLVNILFLLFVLAGNFFVFKGKYILSTLLFAGFLGYYVTVLKVEKGLANRLIIFFSNRVFTIYAIHLPIIAVVNYFLQPSPGILSDLILLVVLWGCIELVYRGIEKPSHLMARNIAV